MIRTLTMLALTLTLLVPAFAVDPVAQVNTEPITEKQFQDTLVDWYGKQVLDEMIQALVIEQAARNANVTATDEEIDKEVLAMQTSMDEGAQAGQCEPFQVWLATRRMTIPNLRARMRTQVLLRKMVEGQATVSAADVSAFYEKNRAQFREPTRVKISVISLKTKEQAEQVRQMIATGEKTWGDAAREFNINPYTMKTGGEIGYRTDDGSPLMQAAMALEQDGDISPVVLFQGLHNIVKREDRQNERTAPFEEVKDSIAQMLKEQKVFALMREMRAGLMKNAHVQRFLQLSGPAVEEPAG